MKECCQITVFVKIKGLINVCYYNSPGFLQNTGHFKIERNYTGQVKTSSEKVLQLGSPVSN